MKRVYIINKSGHNFSAAEEHGSLIYLSEGKWAGRFDLNKIYREFVTTLKESSPDDLILPTGLPAMREIACAIFSRLHGRLNILLYKNGKYIERNIDMDSLLIGEEDESSEAKEL